jgi:hypothetical protein
VDRLQPAERQALLELEPGELDPLRAAPGPPPVQPGAEDELGDACRQQPEALLVLAQPLLRAVLFGAVARDLDEAAGTILERHEEPRRPEARAILAHVPALVLGAAVGTSAASFGLGSAGHAVLRREGHVSAAADDLLLGVAEQALGTDVPARDGAVRVDGEDREVGRTLDDELEQLVLGDGPRLFRFV